MEQTLLGLLGFILIGPFAVIVYYFGKNLHKHENANYFGFGLLAAAATGVGIGALATGTDLSTAHPVGYAFLYQGHISFALYVLVMFAGAFKHKSKAKTTLMRVRREMAIIGFLLLIPHIVLLIWTALSNWNPTGTIAAIIMVPLFITSFTAIRKKMHPLQWKKLHKLAYVVYAVIYLHLASITIIFNIINNTGTDLVFGFIRFGLYTLIFAFYTYLKFKNYILPARASSKTGKPA